MSSPDRAWDYVVFSWVERLRTKAEITAVRRSNLEVGRRVESFHTGSND
jgi:hypothetical protein